MKKEIENRELFAQAPEKGPSGNKSVVYEIRPPVPGFRMYNYLTETNIIVIWEDVPNCQSLPEIATLYKNQVLSNGEMIYAAKFFMNAMSLPIRQLTGDLSEC